ncbi:hypothetical protein CEUSTIGMA_g12221.t1 [Chlamydomonas eustigma]|uniref:Uncharacterized protein n=1 Tax=Chlamydomonas eustigma TaxID=1157962 RepID=A0A250XPS5_9CHLO|nr:hypothetical protein CEUSTIGMA_g12221.t1 [Chlamydomonas eustigma]|eukprot:GAX84800.1 hypothetical protein CEUSTIGMA_g12221.t1 [Chlamydomonas eustigma]
MSRLLKSSSRVVDPSPHHETHLAHIIGFGAQASKRGKLAHGVFFLGLLISTSVLQMYLSGLALTFLLGMLCHPWFYNQFLPQHYLYIVVLVVIWILDRIILVGWIGNLYLSKNGVLRQPSAFLVFLFLKSPGKIMICLYLSIWRVLAPERLWL